MFNIFRRAKYSIRKIYINFVIQPVENMNQASVRSEQMSRRCVFICPKINPLQYKNFNMENRKILPMKSFPSPSLMRTHTEESMSQDNSISLRKTLKIINQPRKKPMAVNFKKNLIVAQQVDGLLGENDLSTHPINQNTVKKDGQFTKAKPINEEINLKNILGKYRQAHLRNNLLDKMRRNSIFRDPVIYQPFSENSNQSYLWQGIQVHRVLLNLAFVISITQTFFTCFLITLLFVFQDKFFDDATFSIFQIFTIVCQSCQILMGLIRVKQVGSRKLTKIREISLNYVRSRFLIDFFCLLAAFICLSISNNEVNYLLVSFFFKIPECVERLAKIETKLFQSFYWQQYWGLMKILLSNFLYAHFIAILILMMSWLDNEQSWMNLKQIVDAPWYEQYAWAYYWGTTIMLTVGFGDLSAANYKQAICLVLIQTVSCMALAYNINCIGNLLKDLNSNELQKEKSLKVLKKLCDKNQINSDLDFKLSNHIKQTYNIQTKFNFEEEHQFISKLPVNLRQDFLRTANYKILQNLQFIRNFTHKTIFALAQKIQMKITHPDELISGLSEINKLIVLKQGEIGFFPNHFNSKFSKVAIDKFVVKEGDPSMLISLDFLQLPITRKFDIKSIVYSQVYYMDTEAMITILKRKDVDKQFFQSMRDKEKIDLDDFETVYCSFCNRNHSKFRCPRIHYMPIIQQVIFKHLHSIKVSKNKRNQSQRVKRRLSCLRDYKKNKHISSNQFVCESTQQFLHKSVKDAVNQNSPSGRIGIRIGRLSNLLSDEQKHNKSSNKEIKTKLLLSAAELMQKQMIDFFSDKERQFWTLQIDEAKDYKFYFSKHNPKCLQNLQLKRCGISRTNTKSISRIKLPTNIRRLT